MLSSRRPPGVVEFETLVAEVGLAVGTALSGLQRLGRFTEATHDRHAAQTHCLPVPEGKTTLRQTCSAAENNRFKKETNVLLSFTSLYFSCLAWIHRRPCSCVCAGKTHSVTLFSQTSAVRSYSALTQPHMFNKTTNLTLIVSECF